MNTSLEVEYWVIDDDGELTPPESLADVSEYTEREFVEPLFELKTPPCGSIAELRTTFVEQLEGVLAEADRIGKGLVPLGTPINCDGIERRPGERGRIQREVLGSNFEYASYCAGTHLHFEKRNVTDQLNALIALDPALALVSSSPYYQGERIANSARAHCYRKEAYAEFPRHGQLWNYVESVGEWSRRLERCFEEFEEEALAAGVDGDAIAESFSADDVVWTPVRLRDEMPTVEWRSPDAALPSQLLRLADELYAVMETIHETNVEIGDGGRDDATGYVTGEGVQLPDYDTVFDLAGAAIRKGLESTPVVNYLDRMGFSVADYHPIATQIGGRQYVTKSDARELRLEYASRLESDVEQLAATID
ncbi:glutamate-cysteine ligase family protein [Natronococcus sp. A-GB1]|uniref:glutamate-cysteine ligase family protein n=1 Tax=Natronococcus sp. A-GB1 TaxID=3037648 RepID=UPI00241E648A|nr:glutamate-cysteine ligase family protein [Natronococcus sp. A-GB1]MDG5758508.1 glutamate-cysteine ligase family protein [Natronococcus sp. A-GB1]